MAFFPAVLDDFPFDGESVDAFFNGRPGAWKRTMEANTMSTDVIDTGDAYAIQIELPGFDKKNVHVRLKDGYLTVSATTETSNDQKGEDGTYVRRERFQGSRSRSFYVGTDLKSSDVKANFTNGLLVLTVPKEVEAPKQEDQTVEIED